MSVSSLATTVRPLLILQYCGHHFISQVQSQKLPLHTTIIYTNRESWLEFAFIVNSITEYLFQNVFYVPTFSLGNHRVLALVTFFPGKNEFETGSRCANGSNSLFLKTSLPL